jgi:hypothetical protein
MESQVANVALQRLHKAWHIACDRDRCVKVDNMECVSRERVEQLKKRGIMDLGLIVIVDIEQS